MAESWYYRLFGEEFGPVSIDVIQELSESGTLGPADELRSVIGVDWITLEQALQSAGTATAVMAPTEDEESDDADPDANWFCKIAGQELGPFAFEELVSFAEESQLSAEDEIRFGEDGRWRTAGSLGRLAAVLPYGKPGLREIPVRMKPAGVSKTPRARQRVTTESSPQQKPPREEPVVRPEIPPEKAWYAWIKGKQHGPYTLEQLAQRIQNGKISAKDFVKQTLAGTWGPPQSALEAFVCETVATPTTEASPPESNSSSSPLQSALKTAPVIDSRTIVAQAPITPMAPAPVASRPAYTPPPKPMARPVVKRQRSSGGGMSFNLGSIIDAKVLGGLVAATLVVGWIYMPVGAGRDIGYLKTLHAFGEEFQAARDGKGEWSKIEAKVKGEIEPMVKDLKSRSAGGSQHIKLLVWAADLRVPKMMKDCRTEAGPAEKEFHDFLSDAAKQLKVDLAQK